MTSSHQALLAIALGVCIPISLRSQLPARPAAAAEQGAVSQDSVLARNEQSQWEALRTRDTTTFGHMMGNGLVDVDLSGIKRTSQAGTARYVMACQTASYALTDLHITHYATTAVVAYKATVDQSCWNQKAPSPLYVMTVYEQRGDTWVPVAHSETAAAKW